MSPAVDSSLFKISDHAMLKMPPTYRTSSGDIGNFRNDISNSAGANFSNNSAPKTSGSLRYQLNYGTRSQSDDARTANVRFQIRVNGTTYLKNLPSILSGKKDSLSKEADIGNRPAFPEGASVSVPTSTTTLEYLLHKHGTSRDSGDLTQKASREESTDDVKIKSLSSSASSFLSRRSSLAENSELAAQLFLRQEPCLFSHRVFQRAARIFHFLAQSVTKEAGEKMTDGSDAGSCDIGNITFEDVQEQIKTFELAFATLTFNDLLAETLNEANFFSEFPHLKKHYSLVCVMLHDLNSRKFQRRTPFPDEQLVKLCDDIENALLSKQTRLQCYIAKERIKRDAPSMEYLLPKEIRNVTKMKAKIPVYLWVNQMKTTLENMVAELEVEGFSKVSAGEDISELTDKVFKLDTHCSDLLVFPAHFDQYFRETKWLRMGHLIQQDKSSCLAPQSVQHLLGIDKDVIHINIGTGLTTAHLASLIKKKSPNSHIWCFGVESIEKARKAVRNVELLGAKNVKILMDDFLSINPEEPKLRAVKVILISANCSKSAVTNPVHFIIREGEDMRFLSDLYRASRAQPGSGNLTAEHERILRHALKFPRVQAVVYATRSCFEAENETVITRALEFTKITAPSKLIPFRVTPPVLPFMADEIDSGSNGISDRYIRFLPSEKSNGCFIAVISREPEDRRDFARIPLSKGRPKGLLVKTVSTPLPVDEKSPHGSDTSGKEIWYSRRGIQKLKGAVSAAEMKTGISSKLAGHKSPAAAGARLFQAGLVHKMEQWAKKVNKSADQKV